MLSLDLDVPRARKIIVSFIADYVKRSGAQGCVVGLSGGLDSAVVARLLVDAVGPERVLGLALPHRASDATDQALAEAVARSLAVEFETTDITRTAESAAAQCAHPLNDHAMRNLMARARMLHLYAHANAMGRLVAGTGNKSELLTGYFTKFGDGGNDLQPIGDIYKTQVRALAKGLGVDERILARPPSAGLAPGQTDEADLGLPYEELDRILLGIELQLPRDAIIERVPTTEDRLARVERLVRSSWHKRATPLIPKIGHRTIGLDWRHPVT